MDTRSKIVTGLGSEIARPLAIVTGYFDVLRAEHARELQAARQGAAAMLVIVLPRSGELLPQRARAELVAGLRAVDSVMIAGPDAEELIASLRPDSLARLEEGDERRARELRELVLGRVAAR